MVYHFLVALDLDENKTAELPCQGGVVDKQEGNEKA